MSMALNELNVLVNGQSVFSYKKKKRMPKPGEIAALIEAQIK